MNFEKKDLTNYSLNLIEKNLRYKLRLRLRPYEFFGGKII